MFYFLEADAFQIATASSTHSSVKGKQKLEFFGTIYNDLEKRIMQKWGYRNFSLVYFKIKANLALLNSATTMLLTS